MKLDFKYKAFISYSHDDDKWANWLHRSVESYRPPKHLVGEITDHGPIPQRMAPVFRDRDELSTATDLGAVINEALEQSACQLVICSPTAARSRWVNEEILAYKTMGREDRIFCLIVAGEPNADERPELGLEECFPEALRYKLGPDGELSNERAEPIAADLRDGKDGKADGKLKIIAGMLGVGFDALKQREQQRRQRRLALIASAATVGMIIATTLATVAIFSRAEAERQRVRAEAEAETAKQTTNFLVDLFSVSDPSEALGNTITAREILDQGARRIEYELEDQPAIKSTLLNTMGTVYMRLGLYGEASTLLERGLATRQELYGRRHPEVARSQANLGELLGLQSELEAAEELYEQAIVIQRQEADAPGTDLAQSLVGLADIHTLQGNFERAEELLREAVEIQRQTLGQENLAVAKSLDSLGMSFWDQGKYDDVEPLLRESLAMRRRAVPGGVHPDIDDGLNNLAVFLFESGEYDESETLFRESLAMNRRLLGDTHPDVAVRLNNLAFVLQNVGDYNGAEASYQEALTIRREHLGEQHPMVGQILNNLAFLYQDMGDTDRALELSRQALAVYRDAYPGDHRDIAYGTQNLAGWLVEAGDYEAAEPLLREALEMHKRLFDPGHPDIAITQTGMAILFLRTARVAAALEMAQAAHASLTESYGSDHWRTYWALATQGAALMQLYRYTEAEPLLLESYEGLRSDPGARPTHIETARRYLADLYTAWDRPKDVARYSKEAGTGL
jgi:tetratricopeptide (TPR) repeat protein